MEGNCLEMICLGVRTLGNHMNLVSKPMRAEIWKLLLLTCFLKVQTLRLLI